MENYYIKSQKDYEELLVELKNLSKNEKVEDYQRHVKILNTKQNVIAISMSVVRKIAHQIYKSGFAEFLELVLDRPMQIEFYEETLIQGLVIAEVKDLELQKNYFKKWINKIDNWSTCDTVVSTMKCFKNAKNKAEYFEFYYNLCFSKQEFVARFGIIVLMDYFLEDEFIGQVLEMCRQVKSEYYYVNMAIAWLLSFAFIKFKSQTYELFKSKTFSKFVQNKAISKCRDSFRVSLKDKDDLVKFRIK